MEAMMQKSLLIAAAAVAYGLVWGSPAQATLMLQTGLVGGSGDVDNVIFNACGLGGSTGTTVQGCLNSSHTTLVNFTSDETLSIGEGGGQAVITSADGAFDFFRIQLADPTLGFSKLQFNLDAIADGTATFVAVDQFGTTFNLGTFALDATGQNFFTLGSIDGQVATKFELVSTVGLEDITDLEQVRLGPASITTNVPEPGTLSLLGLGLLGLGLIRRRK
jgi:hypothetical protein